MNKVFPNTKLQGPQGIKQIGHRDYVGGLWDQMGKLQFDFLVSQGLKPTDYLVDIACGSLRAGVHLIPYLEVGHYLGIEKEIDLIHAGIEKELGHELFEQKKPELVISDSFEFEKFTARPTYGIAQSLFTHLPPLMIDDCFSKLRRVMQPNGAFFATYFEVGYQRKNLDSPHDHLSFAYTRAEIEAFGTRNGWTARYIGEWNHPRDQRICVYHPDLGLSENES